MRLVGKETGFLEEAEAEARRLEEGFDKIRQAVAEAETKTAASPPLALSKTDPDTPVVGVPKKPKVAFLEWLEPLFNGGHWIPDLLQAAGAHYTMAEAGERGGGGDGRLDERGGESSGEAKKGRGEGWMTARGAESKTSGEPSLDFMYLYANAHATQATHARASNLEPRTEPGTQNRTRLLSTGKKSKRLSWQELVAYDADVVLIAPCGMDRKRAAVDGNRMWRHDWWRELRAVKDGKVIFLRPRSRRSLSSSPQPPPPPLPLRRLSAFLFAIVLSLRWCLLLFVFLFVFAAKYVAAAAAASATSAILAPSDCVCCCLFPLGVYQVYTNRCFCFSVVSAAIWVGL